MSFERPHLAFPVARTALAGPLRGPFDPTVAYAAKDVVSFNGSLYQTPAAWARNLSPNPRALTDFTGWTLEAGATAPAFVRATSLPGAIPVAGVTTGGHGSEGTGTGSNDRYCPPLKNTGFQIVTGHTYTVSAYFYLVSGTVPDCELFVTNTGYAPQGTAVPTGTIGAWQRLVVTFTASYTGTAWAYVHSGVSALDFYVTCWQCTETPAAIPYADPPAVGAGPDTLPGWVQVPGTRLMCVEQGTPEHDLSRCMVVIQCPVGFRVERPEFGWPIPMFRNVPLGGEALANALRQFADVDIEDVSEYADAIDASIRNLTVEIGEATSE